MKPLPLQSTERIEKILELIRAHSRQMAKPAASSIIELFGRDPYLILVSCILSLRTKDQTSFAASCELFKQVTTPEQMVEFPLASLERLLYPVGFYRQKARQLKLMSIQLVEKFKSKVPRTYEELIDLPGVGPKTANLVLGYAFGVPAICVDTHVHKLSNRLGLVATTTVEQTQRELEKIVPKKYWIEFNELLVIWGQNICVPVSPLCSQCVLRPLCHVASTGDIKHFKLLNLSGSYWRADKKNQALQRISGTAFLTKDEMQAYEQHIEDAQKYDHRRLGKQLDLFSFHEEGVGFPFFHPKGKLVLNLLQNYLRTLLTKAGYLEIQTPIMLSDELWKQSGHYAHYKNNMYFCTIDEKNYAVRPMNCPGSILIYKERPRSYKELPLRLSEFGLVHRFELSGVLHGLFRVRSFTIDDAHIYCTPDQIEQEVLKAIELNVAVFKKFGFDQIHIGLSTRPDNAMGSESLWNIATNALAKALTNAGLPFKINEGDGAFYGPKIEFGIQDSMGREWQCGTIQLDFFQPENFDLSYVASGGSKERPVMIHRAIYGSFERFFAIMLEHFKGNLPFWVSPVQAKLLTITDAQKPYATSLLEQLSAEGIRAEMDMSNDQISGQIKAAQLEKIPWMLVIGKKEVENGTVTLRTLDGKQEFGLTIAQLIQKAKELL